MYSNLRRLESASERMLGKEVRRPSDDPVRVVTALGLRSSLGETEQYQSNIENAQSWLEMTEDALGNATQVLQRARELAVYGATDTLPEESREALAKEVEQLRDQLGMIANTVHGDSYIFGGTKTDKAPYILSTDGNGDEYIWQGNTEDIKLEIATGVEMAVNTPGKELFFGTKAGAGQEETKGAIKVLDKLAKSLNDSDTKGSEISNMIGKLDKVLDNFIATRGEIGAKVNRLEMSMDRLEQSEVTFTELLSQAEDSDLAEAIMDLRIQENAYRVTLAAGARVITPTLIDFLR